MANAGTPSIEQYPDAHASDPVRLGWMQGFPPPPDKTLRFADGSALVFPGTRWSLSHAREFAPTKGVARGDGPACALPRAERDDLDAIRFTTLDGRPMTWGESLAANYTDGILVMHRGKLIYERYFGVLKPHMEHRAFSVTKSFVGTLAMMLAHDGALDTASPVPRYVPELARSAYADATVRQVMDMTVAAKYSEVYSDFSADIWRYAVAGGMVPAPAGYDGPKTFYDYLVTIGKEGAHDDAFGYRTIHTEVLAWILRRVAGQSLSELLSERIWSRLGAQHDAYFVVDSIGTESGGGGLCTTLRDLARFGEAMRCEGAWNGCQIVPAGVVADIRRGADRERFVKAGYTTLPGYSYRSQWWVSHNDHGVFTARGIHGQLIWVDPKAQMVIARYASHPVAANMFIDPTSLPAYAALSEHLMREGG